MNSTYLDTQVLFNSWGFHKARYQNLGQKKDQLTDTDIGKRLLQPAVLFLALQKDNAGQSKKMVIEVSQPDARNDPINA